MREPEKHEEGKYHNELDSTENVGFKLGLKRNARFPFMQRMQCSKLSIRYK